METAFLEDARDEALKLWRDKAKNAYSPADLADYRRYYEVLDEAIKLARRLG